MENMFHIKSWSHGVLAFRENPSLYIESENTSEQEILYKIIETCSDKDSSNQIKIYLLLLLQDYSDVLITSDNSFDHVINNLLKICSTSPNIYVHVQILNTLTSILIVNCLSEKFINGVAKLFNNFILHVLNLSFKQSDASTFLQEKGFRCLVEIESCFPGILKSEIDVIFDACQNNCSTSSSYYFSLFSLTLKNALEISGEESSNIPYFLHPPTLASSDSKTLLTFKDKLKLKKIISLFIENTFIFSPDQFKFSINNLFAVVATSSDIGFIIFKSLFLKYMKCKNIIILHCLVKNWSTFASSTLSDQELKSFFLHLCNLIVHPFLKVYQRNLLLEWCICLLDSKNLFLEPISIYTIIWPKGYDTQNFQLKKFRLLVVLMNRFSTIEPSHIYSTLNNCFQVLPFLNNESIMSSFFSALYFLFRCSQISSIDAHIERIFIEVIDQNSKYIQYCLDFLEITKHSHPNSSFTISCSRKIIEHVSNISIIPSLDILHYLKLIEAFAQLTEININLLIIPIKRLSLFVTNISDPKLCWICGHIMLNIFRYLLQHPSIDLIKTVLSGILMEIQKSHPDIDVKDRASFYYCIHHYLAPNKVSEILLDQQSFESSSGNLAFLVTKGSSFPAVLPLQVYPVPVLTLSRLNSDVFNTTLSSSLKNKANICDYLQQLQNKSLSKTLNYKLKIADTCQFDDLYGITIKFVTNDFFKNIQDINLPFITKNQEEQISIKFQPVSPVPVDFSLSSIFNDKNGINYTADIELIKLSIEDLFHPPLCAVCIEKDLLWETLKTTLLDKDRCIESLVSLSWSEHNLNELSDGKWKIFLLEKTSNSNVSLVSKFWMHILPSSNLLLEIKADNKNNSVVTIITDEIELLPLISSFLFNLFC